MFADKTKIFGKIFFYAFVFLLPWQTRFIFTPEKPEFLSFSIYLSEIFFWLALALWLTSADLKKIRIPNIFLFFCFFVFLSILWSPDRVAAFRLWLFIFDGIMIYLFLREHDEMRRGAIKIFLLSLFAASLFGIWQFFNLGSPAWKWLGLAARGAWNLGDIVVESSGGRWLRAYGPFPHPNIFGGYLAAGILLLFVILKPKAEESRRSLTAFRMTILYSLGGIFLFALFLTFSRSAWLALAAASVYFLIKNISPLRIAPASRWSQGGQSEASRKNLKYFSFLLLLLICLSIIFYPFIKTRATSAGRLEQKSNAERVESWSNGLAAWYKNPIFGSGLIIGHQVANGYLVANSAEPPHNIFILVLSQLGLAGFLIYLFFLWRGFWKNPIVRPLLILFFIIGMLDHYLWTLWPGQALFWTIPALLGNIDDGGKNGSAES